MNEENLNKIIRETINRVKPVTLEDYRDINERLARLADKEGYNADELTPPSEEDL